MRVAVIAFSVIAVCCLVTSAAEAPEAVPTPDRAYIDAVLDGLVAEGVLGADAAQALKQKGDRAAVAVAEELAANAEPAKKHWYDTTKISGYAQGRWLYYPDADEDEADNEFSVRRARIKVAAKPADDVKVQIQADFGEGDATIKDAWLQKYFGSESTSSIRIGQQKLPFGFETPQSSSRRLPLERNWVARRTISGERDTGITYFYTAPEDKDLFGHAKSELFGTGDYGNIAIGVYNGQGIGADVEEVNSDKHIVLRACKPLMVGLGGGEEKDQYVEFGASYFAGDYFSTKAETEFSENLFGVHAYLAPQPFGLQAEYYNGETEGHDIDGWYAMGIYSPEEGDGTLFVRYDDMNGWRKGKNADYSRDRWSIGYAHDIDSKTRLTVEYDIEQTDSGSDNDLFGIQIMTKY